jgi:hypothetical protein
LVAGHYQPLADNPGVAPEPDQTRSLQSDQRTLGKSRARLFPAVLALAGLYVLKSEKAGGLEFSRQPFGVK